ncbi:MAG TPA: hypothetical protein VHD56_02500 [Tepidisphaeraceae bacterium]|nr:hypothetical protein [Tepidisphaeraceae bacterium]
MIASLHIMLIAVSDLSNVTGVSITAVTPRAFDSALLLFIPLAVLSFFTIALAMHACRLAISLRVPIMELRRAAQTKASAADSAVATKHHGWANAISEAAAVHPEAAARAIDNCIAPYDNVVGRIGLAREIALPLAMFACAAKMIAALTSIGTAPIARSSSLIGASLWGTVFGVSLYVIAALAEGWLRICVGELEACLEQIAVDFRVANKAREQVVPPDAKTNHHNSTPRLERPREQRLAIVPTPSLASLVSQRADEDTRAQ